jgi:hypothetical protein
MIFLFSTTIKPILGPTKPRMQWVPGAASTGVKRPGREAYHSLPSRLRMVEVQVHSPICLHDVVLNWLCPATILPHLSASFHILFNSLLSILIHIDGVTGQVCLILRAINVKFKCRVLQNTRIDVHQTVYDAAHLKWRPKSAILQDITPSSPEEVHQRFGGTYSHYIQGKTASQVG